MQDLQLIGVHEDGEHLLLSGADGARFTVRVDDALRAAIRRDPPRLGQLQIEIDGGLRPRDVQALIRSGVSAQEVAERAGWTVDKVRRYEGPIIAERDHVARLARNVRLRGRGGSSGGSSAPTLSTRVGERLTGRGVDQAGASWDSWRSEEGPWTVVLTFPAGGRQRQASWHFDMGDRTVTAVDDEARWLSEDEQPPAGPIPAPHLATAPARATRVYDVEAEGGLRPATRAEGPEEPVDLMTAMRERSGAHGRRKTGSRRGSKKVPTNVPGAGEQTPDEALPLEDLGYDPETMPPPPGAHADPDPDGVDGVPEPEVAADVEPQEQPAPRDTPESEAEPRPEFEPESAPEPESRPELESRLEPGAEAASHAVSEQEQRSAPAAEAKPVAAPRARTPRRSGRSNVPAWEDIMFGSKQPGADS